MQNNQKEKDINQMSYVEFMAYLRETNRPPGGKKILMILAQNTFLNPTSKIIHVGCNTGSSTMEMIHLTKCSAFGVDKEVTMVEAANKIYRDDLYYNKVKFQTGNAEDLKFKDNYFDLFFSAGSMAFVKNKEAAVREAVRIIKLWGFIADIVMFYHKKPPRKIIDAMNKIMGIEIKLWNLNFWENLYLKEDLEYFYSNREKMRSQSQKEVENYCKKMVAFIKDRKRKAIACKRLLEIMMLFNENHKYLSYGLLIFRKREKNEQETLFGL